MNKKILTMLLVLSFITVGCSKNEEYVKKEVTINTIDSINSNDAKKIIDTDEEDELAKILTKNNYIVVDARTKEEYEEGHVKGALNIPYDTIDENTKLDKTKTILVYCKSGNRSSKAYKTLKELEYDVYDLGAYETITLEKE